MDEQRARDYCYAAHQRMDRPPSVDVEDLVQDFLLAELEGLDPCKVVSESLQASVAQAKATENGQRMTFVTDDCQREPGETDAEHDEYLQTENEITVEHWQQLRDNFATVVAELRRTHPDYAEVIEYLFSYDGKSADQDISEVFGTTMKQARHLRSHGISLCRKIAKKLEIDLPLFGLKDEVANLTIPHRKFKQYRPQENDVICRRNAV